jgi:DNA-binding NarL/FixJ family response regulator
MLLGGLTDEAMARALDISVRTEQRHIHTLMDAVGAETRLQLGMEIVRHGWI